MPSTTMQRAYASQFALVQSIYQTCNPSQSWMEFMQQLVDVLDSRSARLLIMNGSADQVHNSYVINHDESFVKKYVDYYVNQCPWRPELVNKPKGMVYSSYLDFSCKQTEFRRTEFYNDWAKPQNIEHGICGTIYQQRNKTIQLLVQRTKETGYFTREETDFVNSLVPHIQNVIQLRSQMCEMQQIESRVVTLTDRYQQPFALIDEKLNVRYISQLMKQKIEYCGGLTLSGDRLLAKDSNENARLYRLIQESRLTASGCGNYQGGVVNISADYPDKLHLRVMPCPVELGSAATLFKHTFVVVFLSSSSMNFSIDTQQLSILYDLTERESQLAARLCQGLSIEEIAQYNGVKTSTLRKQLKSIYVKTSTHRQGELIVMLLNSLAVYRS